MRALRVVGLMAFVILTALPGLSENLLTNPDFTTGVAGWLPAHWVSWVATQGDSTGSGPGCAEVALEAFDGNLYGITQELVAVTAGANYVISGSAFVPSLGANPAEAAECAIEWWSDTALINWSFFATLTGRDRWSKVVGATTAPPGATRARARFGVRVPNSGAGTSRARWDDVFFGPAAEAPRSVEYFVPGAGNNPGKWPTWWTTELTIYNPLATSLKVEAAFLSGTGDNSGVPFVHLGTLDPGTTVRFANVVAALGATGNGALRLRCSALADPVRAVITARTATPGPSGGSYGLGPLTQSAPSVQHLATTGLVQGTAFRSNVGVVNPNAQEVTTRLRVLDGNGATVVEVDWKLGPYGAQQLGLPSLGIAALDRGTLLVDGSNVIAYATTVDQVTGDCVYLLATPLD